MGEDAERNSPCKSFRPDRSHTIFETSIPIRPTNSQYENPSLIIYIDELMNVSDANVVIVYSDTCQPCGGLSAVVIKRLDKSKDTVSRLLLVRSELVVLVPCIAVDGLSSAEL